MLIIINYDKPILVLISLELLLISICILYLSKSIFIDDILGFIITLLILVFSAAEASVGITIIMSLQSQEIASKENNLNQDRLII